MASPSGPAEPTANQGSSNPMNHPPAANSTGMSFSVDVSHPGGHDPSEQRPAVIDHDEGHQSPEAPVPITADTINKKKKKKKKSKSKKNKAVRLDLQMCRGCTQLANIYLLDATVRVRGLVAVAMLASSLCSN